MGQDRSKDTYRAIGLLFPRSDTAQPAARLLASGSYSGEVSYSQAGPFPGAPRAASTNTTRITLQATGELTAPLTADMEVRIHQGGLPWPAGSARLTWRYAGSTNYHGWDVPTLLTGWEAIEWTDGGGGYLVKDTRDPHALGCPNGKLVVAYQDHREIGATVAHRVMAAVRSTAGVWTKVILYSQEDAPTYGYNPALWRAPAQDEATGGTSGALYCGHWVEDLTDPNAPTANIRVYRTTDTGASWTMVQARALKDDIDISPAGYELGRIRVQFQNGQSMMVVSLKTKDTTAGKSRDIFQQLASPDEGFAFTTVALWDKNLTGSARQGGKYHELLILNGRFTLIYVTLNNTVSAYRPVYRQTAEAYEDIRNDAEQAIDGSSTSDPWADQDATNGEHFISGDLAAAVDWDGKVYVYGREVNLGTTNEEGVCFRSNNYGRTYEYVGASSARSTGKWWYGRHAVTYPHQFTVAPQDGRMALVHNWMADAGDEGESLACTFLGGWSEVTMPALSGFPLDTRRVGWEWTWLPYDLPSDMGWAATTGGTWSATLQSPGHGHLTTTAGRVFYEVVPTTTTYQGLIVLLEMKVGSGGSLTADDIGAELDICDGAGAGYSLSVRCRNNAFQVQDNIATTIVGTAPAVTLTSYMQILLAFSGDGTGDGQVSTWYRSVTTGSSRAWTQLHNAAAIQVGAVAANVVRVGLGLAGNITAAADFRIIGIGCQQYTGRQLSGGQDNPSELFPGPCSVLPYPTDSGMRVFSRNGPGATGDSWTIPTDYSFPARKLLPEVSSTPRTTWRSTDLTEQKIALEIDAADTRPPSDTIVLALFNVHQRTHYLEGRSAGTGAWTTLATLDAAQGCSAVPYLRSGASMRPNAAAGGSQHPFLLHNDKLGGYARLGANRIRRILGQTSGAWQTLALSGTFTHPEVTIDAPDAGDPASGTAQLWSPQVAAIVHLCGAEYNAYRLRIPNQEAPNTYFEVGTAFFGYVHILAHQYAWGRTWDYEDGTTSEELEDGRTVVYEAAPGRRQIELNWTDTDAEFLWGNDPDPDYVLNTSSVGGIPSGTPQATAFDLEGIWRQCRGKRDCMLYLPYVPKGPDNAIVLTSRQDVILARITGPPQQTNYIGDEHEGEVIRTSIVLREQT